MIRRGVSEKGLELELVLIQYSLQQTGSSKWNDKIEDVSIYRRDETRSDHDHDIDARWGVSKLPKRGDLLTR
jgi:hypothetical protein